MYHICHTVQSAALRESQPSSSHFYLLYNTLENRRSSKLLASERSERDTIRGVQIRAVQIRAGAVYIYIYVWRYVCHNSSSCHAYVMWAELDHCHFLYVPAVLNVVTTGNGTGTKNVLK